MRPSRARLAEPGWSGDNDEAERDVGCLGDMLGCAGDALVRPRLTSNSSAAIYFCT